MGSGYENEIYQETYAIRARVEAIDSRLQEISNLLQKTNRMLAQIAAQSGGGEVPPGELAQEFQEKPKKKGGIGSLFR